jgi:dihydropteroate synthase
LKIYQLGDIDKKEALKELGVKSGGISILSNKMDTLSFYIKGLPTPALNILKQDALSIGADLAVPSGVITCSKSHYNSILIGTKKHIKILSQKELAQPFGLKEVAKELKRYLKTYSYPIEIMGIINANEDSFYSGSRFLASSAIAQIESMVDDGADIIDIGGVSSRPMADSVSVEEELSRIRDICDSIKERELYKDVLFSIDSYEPIVVEYALKSGFGLINDITGAIDERIINLAIEYGAKLAIMHKKGSPKSMQDNPHYNDVMVEVGEFFEKQIAKCEKLGLDRESIILDVGIGFGKSLEHNIRLIKNLKEFQKFGCPLLIGASRKSMIDHISPTAIEKRLEGSLAIHLKAIDNGASIIRCHDVVEHKRALRVWELL